MSSSNRASIVRPVVYDYGPSHDFFREMQNYLKATSRFSVRRRTRELSGCSPALVSQILSGKRRLTRDQLPTLAKLFNLTELEFEFLDKKLRQDLQGANVLSAESPKSSRIPKNHILSFWLNLYVKDLVHLRGFSLETPVLYRMLMGLATPKQIERSVKQLLSEGFWRLTPAKKVVAEDQLLVSTNEIPDLKVRKLHLEALKIAARGLSAFPISRRKATTVLVSVDKTRLTELRCLLDSFQRQLCDFVEKNPCEGDELVQVAIHMTPVGVSSEKI